MKALKILKEKAFVVPANGNKIYKAEDIDEAISELEALQQHIKSLESQLSSNPLQLTCDGCKKEQLKIENGGSCPFWCQRDFRQDQYESKDTK